MIRILPFVLLLMACGDMSGAHEGALVVQAPMCTILCFTFVIRGDWADQRTLTKETYNLLEDRKIIPKKEKTPANVHPSAGVDSVR